MIGIKHKLTICFYLITQKKKGKRTRDIILTCKFWSQPNLQFAFIQLLKKKKEKRMREVILNLWIESKGEVLKIRGGLIVDFMS